MALLLYILLMSSVALGLAQAQSKYLDCVVSILNALRANFFVILPTNDMTDGDNDDDS